VSEQHAASLTPWLRGHADGFAGKPGPTFHTPDSSWEARLYAAGWSRGVDARIAALKCTASASGKHVLFNDWWCEQCDAELPHGEPIYQPPAPDQWGALQDVTRAAIAKPAGNAG
jgi:hypothetical protein